ncbi:MAG: hypothetical protein P1T08_17735 [Acidimicrobiia bacterium]|nr:hypothetical protein [Acidimicrobiia bacterium]
MAKRPVFIPDPTGALVAERMVEFEWHPGFALVQKRKNIDSLHRAAVIHLGREPLLEVSSKSPRALGARLSAFNLHVPFREFDRRIPLESAFQGSKVFAASGQHTEIYEARSGAEAKKAAREYDSEALVAFMYEGRTWPLEPKTVFYDWLYIGALLELWGERPALLSELSGFQGFTDIEFNPKRSLNCQARSCALFVALASTGDIDRYVRDPDIFVAVLGERGYCMPPGPIAFL